MMSGLRHPAGALALALMMGICAWAPGQAVARTSHAQASARHQAVKPAASQQFVDGIAAVVNQQVITLGQLEEKVGQVRVQLQQQRVPVPDEATLRHQVLQQMINQALQDQAAQKANIHVSDAQLDRAIQDVARRNRFTVDQLKVAVQRSGLNWDQYRNELRTQILDDFVRQHFVEDKISITDSDVDSFLNMYKGEPLPVPAAPAPQPEPKPEPPRPQQPERVPFGPELFELSQILVEVPNFSSTEVVAEKRKKAEAILRKLKAGGNFAGLAASSSDGPQALQGGDMGIRPLKDWPDLFARAVKNIPPGGITGILQSGRGFHILKVVRRGYQTRPAPKAKARPQPKPEPQPQPAEQPAAPQIPANGPMMVTQTHARHILIKVTKVVDDAKAKQILENLRQRIEHGESFAELAKRYSQDSTAPLGGDLGWLNPGDTVPAFEQAMNKLKDGQVSEPVKTPFGWHLIQVEGRRTKNMEQEYRRVQARRILMDRRIGPAYEDWLDQLRAQAYIDNRLDKKPGQ
ncbi:MAG TPA: peptidylprolyl isomerase [Castellaniella sp.]|uniref:peptidylprolyl isomerase n=1 Tax=Castellaniella sp. TaxID=1955812 RepID=UPI002EF597B0